MNQQVILYLRVLYRPFKFTDQLLYTFDQIQLQYVGEQESVQVPHLAEVECII